jgi:uncharacterized membrane protein YozB (DUF420 family)
MFLTVLRNLVVLLAGPAIEVSQTTLTVMFVVLGIVLMGIGFGHISKTKTNLLQHRWTLTTAVALSMGAIFLVMVPSFFVFYIAPDLQFLGMLSFTTLIHSVIGAIAVVTGLIYVFGDLPADTKKWMRITALLWIITLTLGVLRFLQTIP